MHFFSLFPLSMILSLVFTLDNSKYIIYQPILMSAKAENEDASPRAILGRVHSLSTPISSLPLSIISKKECIHHYYANT